MNNSQYQYPGGANSFNYENIRRPNTVNLSPFEAKLLYAIAFSLILWGLIRSYNY